MRQIAVANREAPGKVDTGICWEETQPYDRHTQGTYWHMRLDTLAQGHARARTRSRTQRTRSRTHGVEAAQMRLCHIHVTKSPGAVLTPAVIAHAPSLSTGLTWPTNPP